MCSTNSKNRSPAKWRELQRTELLQAAILDLLDKSETRIAGWSLIAEARRDDLTPPLRRVARDALGEAMKTLACWAMTTPSRLSPTLGDQSAPATSAGSHRQPAGHGMAHRKQSENSEGR